MSLMNSKDKNKHLKLQVKQIKNSSELLEQ